MTIHIYALSGPSEGISPDSIRYIGKTSEPIRKRFKRHIYAAVSKRELNHRTHWINKIINSGSLPEIHLIASAIRDEYGSDLEIGIISQYLKMGARLVNGTSGGEGASGLSIESRSKISKSNADRVWKDESRRKISESLSGRIVSEETREKISRSSQKKRSPLSKETREKISQSLRNRINRKDSS